MCGISAVKSLFGGALAEDKSQLEAQLWASVQTMGHRGPDSSGIYVSKDSSLGFAHARLSIIDLEGGQQPLHDSTNTIHAIVNGEFYDYDDIRRDLESKRCVFHSAVDSELVIHLYQIYGQNFIHHLRGEFAFVLYDSRRQLLMAARDRFGIKPLYYTVTNGKLMLASEMKALQPLGWKPEWDVESISQSGEFVDHRTVFKGVYKLAPGHLLTCARNGHIEVRRYWDLEYPNASVEETRTLDEMIDGVRQRVIDAVRVRLRSDVPLGVYLSGGIDSASAAGIASHLLKEKDPDAKLMTFTLAFPGRKEHDEGPVAQRMAESIGASIHMVAPTEEDLVQQFPKAVYHCEQPMMSFHGTGKMILSNYVHDRGYKVILSGEGSDEVFGGYYFFMPDFLCTGDPAARNLGIPLPGDGERLLALKKFAASGLRQDHLSLERIPMETGSLGRELLGGIRTHGMVAITGLSDSAFTPLVHEHITHADRLVLAAEGISPDVRRKIYSGQWHPLNSASYTMAKTGLTNMLLNTFGDRPEMANSIEGRTPFLDHHLVEYVNTIPPSVKIMPSLQQVNGISGINGHSPEIRNFTFTEKWVLREAVKPFVTDEIYRRAKVQYNSPIAPPTRESMAGGLSPLQLMLKARLTKEAVEQLGWGRWEYVEGVLNEYLEAPECPADGGLDRRARILLAILSFVIIQERFQVPAWAP
ncbi:hypothetical protein VNI00_009630 [Paramarasmius palmivorus]|uniref:Glutamine amidotransferase type-2 domain-containing protein n=1 Tax=Paramarasmius palmivorus TaxID=297713 RepID=A0AAW0CP30_9AGAR